MGRSYEQLKNRGGFSEELLAEVLRGMSARRYEETVTKAGEAFGVTPSSVSRHLVEATARQLKQFQERSLEEFWQDLNAIRAYSNGYLTDQWPILKEAAAGQPVEFQHIVEYLAAVAGI